MTQTEKFHDTISILVKAYLIDELKHGDCSACVVGNLCGGNTYWKYLFVTSDGVQMPFLNIADHDFKNMILRHHGKTESELIEMATDSCLKTGYTIDELMKIEFAFESATMGRSPDDWMFNGLMAVVDVLSEIHGINIEQAETAKLLFTK